MDEDLRAANYKLVRDAYKHSHTLASWSSQGKVFAELKNGKTVRIKYGTDIDEFFKKEMPTGISYPLHLAGVTGFSVVHITAALHERHTIGRLCLFLLRSISGVA